MRWTRPDVIHHLLALADGDGETWSVEADLQRYGLSEAAAPLLRRLDWGASSSLDLATNVQVPELIRRIGEVVGRRMAAERTQEETARLLGRILSGPPSLERASRALENLETARELGFVDGDDATEEGVRAAARLMEEAGAALVENAYDRGATIGLAQVAASREDEHMIPTLRAVIRGKVANSDAPLPTLEGWLGARRASLRTAAAEPETPDDRLVAEAITVAAAEEVADEMARAAFRARFLAERRTGDDGWSAVERTRASYTEELLDLERRCDDLSLSEDERWKAELEVEAIGRVHAHLLSDREVADLMRLGLARSR